MNLGVTTVVMNGAGVRAWHARDARVSGRGAEASGNLDSGVKEGRAPMILQTTSPG